MLSLPGAGPHLLQGYPWGPPGESSTHGTPGTHMSLGDPKLLCKKQTHLFETLMSSLAKQCTL